MISQADELCTATSRLFTWRRLVDWWYGNRVENAWVLLHHAELLVIDNSNPALLPVLLEEAVDHAAVLDQTDPARERLTNYVKGLDLPIGSQQ